MFIAYTVFPVYAITILKTEVFQMVFEEKTISTKEIFSGKIINVRVDTIETPDKRQSFRELVDHPGGVGIVAITNDDKIILVKQFRKSFEKAIYEIPAGKLEKGEEHYTCGVRELEEETGFKAEKIAYLGCIYPSPGFVNEITHIYLATDLYEGKLNPDDGEHLDIEFFDVDEVIRMIMDNELNDAKTVAGVFKALKYLGRI